MRGSSHPPLRIIRRISMRRGGLGLRRGLGWMLMGAGGDILLGFFFLLLLFYILYNILCIIYIIMYQLTLRLSIY